MAITLLLGQLGTVRLAAQQLGSFEPGTEGQMWQSLPAWGQQNVITAPLFCLNSDPPPDSAPATPTATNPDYYGNFLLLNRTCTINGVPGQPPPLGQFLFPYAAVADGLTLFVTDLYNHRIQAFTSQANGVPQVLPLSSSIGNGTYGNDATHLNAPAGLVVLPVKNSTRHVLGVADSGNSRIAFFDSATGAPAFAAPSHFQLDAVDVSGTQPLPYAIAAQPGTILQFDGQLRPTTGSGIIVVPDAQSCYVQIYDDGLHLKSQIPSQAAFAAALMDPLFVPFNEGQGGACVSPDLAGNLPPSGFFGSPGGAAVDAAGHIFVADYLNSRIQIFDATGTWLASFGTPPAGLPPGTLPPPGTLQAPYGITIDHLNRVIVTDSENERIAFFSVDFTKTLPSGALAANAVSYLFQLNAAGSLNGNPTGIVEQTQPDSAGRIFATDTTNHRVQWFQLPNLAIIQPAVTAPSGGSGLGSFGIAVPAQKTQPVIGVAATAGGVTLPACYFLGADDPSNCVNNPTPVVSDGVTSIDGGIVGAAGAVSPQPPAGPVDIAPGQVATFGFAYSTSAPVPNFRLNAQGNAGSTMAPTVYSSPAVACSACSSSAVTLAKQTLTPVSPYVSGSDNWYKTPLVIRITATGTPGFLGGLKYQFTSGPNSGAVRSVNAAIGAATLIVDVTIPSESYNNILQFWVFEVDGSEEQDHHGKSYSIDLTAPAVTFTYNGSPLFSSTQWYKAPVVVGFSVSDNNGSGTASSVPASGTTITFSNEGRNQSQSVTATDNVGNTTTPAAKSQLVNIDKTAPNFVANAIPASVTFELANSSGLGKLVTGSAADTKFKGWVLAPASLATDPNLADGTLGSGVVASGVSVPASGTTATTSVSVTVTDVAGNARQATIPVVVTDTTPPSISCSATPVSLSLPGTMGVLTVALPDVRSQATASDISGSLTLTQSPLAGTLLSVGSSTVIVTAKDATGNSSTCPVPVSVTDVTPPVITVPVPGPSAVTAGTNTTAVVTYTVSAQDNRDGVRPVTCTPVSGFAFSIGQTAVSCSSTDLSGNIGTNTFQVSVSANNKPTVTAPANQTIEATSPAGAFATFAATRTDPIDGPGPAPCTPASGSLFPIGTTTVTCWYGNSQGGSDTKTFTVTVRDSIKPVITIPTAAPTAEATSTSGAGVTYSVSASDGISGSVAVTCAPASGSTFAIGTTVVNCSAADSSGNTAQASFNVVVQDTTPPVVTLPAPPVFEATGATGAAGAFTVTGADVASTPVVVTCTPASGSTFPLGTTTVACTGKDSRGNTSAASSFVVTVRDTTPPAVTVPASVTVGATSTSGATVTYTATAIDLVDGSRPLTCAPASGTTFPIGTTTVTCSGAADTQGNAAPAKTFPVTVSNLPPTITQSNIVAIATSTLGAVVTFTPQVTDPSDPHPVVTCVPKSSGSTFPVGTTSETCTARNTLGLTASVTFTVTVNHSAPICTSATPSSGSLWPPNHQLVPISIKGLTTVDGGTITTVIKSIYQDEPTAGLGDGDTSIDGYGVGSSVAQVRAERSGTLDGRFYYIGYTATTPGGSCNGTVTVVVPHDQGHNPVGQGSKYDSTKVSHLPNDTCHGESSHGHHDGDGCTPGHHGHYSGDKCKGNKGDGYHHEGDNCIAGHHGHYEGDNCKGGSGYHHDGDGHSSGWSGGYSHH